MIIASIIVILAVVAIASLVIAPIFFIKANLVSMWNPDGSIWIAIRGKRKKHWMQTFSELPVERQAHWRSTLGRWM